MRRPKLATRIGAGFAASTLLLFGAAACGDTDDTDVPDSSDVQETDEPDEPEEADEADEPEATGDGATPSWAHAATTPGEQIAELTVGDLEIQVYRVGMGAASKDGILVDAETEEPLMKEGDEIVFLNFVITNTGAPIDLGSSLVNVSMKYDDWGYLGGMPTEPDTAAYEEQGINKQLRDPSTGLPDPAIYTLGTGETVSYGEGYLYQAGTGVTISGSYTPVDDAGDLIHSDKQEGETTATIE